MSAYLIFQRDKMKDEAEFATYSGLVPDTLKGHPVKILALYGAQKTLEGAGNEGTAILEFPTKEAALAWYDGEAYKRVREHRFKASDYNVTLVDGFDGPHG